MSKIKHIFHLISYLQYPAMLTGLFYTFIPYLDGANADLEHLNNALVFVGLGISLSTLQDTAKTQNKLFKLILENPKKGKTIIVLLSVITFLILVLGIFGIFFSGIHMLNELYFGLILLGVGLIGFLKSAIEVMENARI
ncbi:MAG: hypothetical protein E4H26_11850 [Flavobacteriales bacterium]|nr:MAG: hypothetical protein E4H26_11850 [Flavobacteriales bacterium]